MVIGAAAVLTARHVVAGVLDGGSALARVVRAGASTADWVPMIVLAEDEDWDVALLGVDHGNSRCADGAGPEWLKPVSPPPVFVQPGTSAEHGCEAVGFPQSEVQLTPDGSPVATVRQTEQAVGTLLPAGQAKMPVNPERPLPRHWMPLDIEGPPPDTQADWGGMSGAGVVIPDGRLVGLVTDAEARHQQRRLYVVPFGDALAQSGRIVGALSAALGSPVVIEAREAPLYRELLEDGCLAPDGLPVRVREASLKAFGVKLAGVPGEPAFLDYVPRDADKELWDGLQTARAESRMLLVVGGSAGGKSRSAAEAVRLSLRGHRLLCPRQTSLARLCELSLADLGPAVAWLDDAERYDDRAFRDCVDRLHRSGIIVVATIRRTELQARMPKDDLRDPLGDALMDKDLVVQVPWPVIWNDQERARVREHVSYPALLAWVAAGKSPSAWIVAGPALQDRLRDAKADDERPIRYALIRTVLDWYRTGITQPIPVAIATSLLPEEAESTEVDDALRWGLESVTGAARTTSQSLLRKTPSADALTVHDYIQDTDARSHATAVPDAVWTAALNQATANEARYAMGYAAAVDGNTAVASKAWLLLADQGDSSSMYNLGALFRDSDPGRARHWWQKAAEAGHPDAMYELGMLLEDSDLGRARHWWQRAAEAGHPGAMHQLAMLLEDSDPGRARHWFERGALAGNRASMFMMGLLLADSDPSQARSWYEQAAWAGNRLAMYNLGEMLEDSDPAQALELFELAAAAGITEAEYHVSELRERLAESGIPERKRGFGVY